MFSHYLLVPALTALSVLVSTVAAINFTYVPTLVQCQQVVFNWTATVPPYEFYVFWNNRKVGRNLAYNYPDTSFTWTVDFPTGSTVSMQVNDATGAYQILDLIVQPGSSTNCLTASAALTILPPSTLVQCQPVAIAWTGGVAPYQLLVRASSNQSTLLEFDDLTTTSYSWTVNYTAGDSVFFYVADSKGSSSYTGDRYTIQPGTSSDCLYSSPSNTTSGGTTTTPDNGPSHPPNPNPHPNQLSSGAIAGIAIGAVVLVAAACLLGFCLYRRKKSRNVGLVADLDTNEYDDQQVTPLEPTMSQNRSSFGQYSQFPTMSPALQTSNPRSSQSGMSSTRGASNEVPDPFLLVSQDQGSSANNNSVSTEEIGRQSSLHKRRSLPQSPVPILTQEDDAGPVPVEGGTVPPRYDSTWAGNNAISR